MVDMIIVGIISSILSVTIIKLHEKYYVLIKELYRTNLSNVKFCKGVIKSNEKFANLPKNTFITRSYSTLVLSDYINLDCYKQTSLYPKDIQYSIYLALHHLELLEVELRIQAKLYIHNEIKRKNNGGYTSCIEGYVSCIKEYKFNNVIQRCEILAEKIKEYRHKQQICIISFFILLLYIVPFVVFVK